MMASACRIALRYWFSGVCCGSNSLLNAVERGLFSELAMGPPGLDDIRVLRQKAAVGATIGLLIGLDRESMQIVGE
jgi:hypothetical protein